MSEDSFQDWLIQKHQFKIKSAGDVRSRLRRASKFIDVLETIPDDELLFKLNRIGEFKELKPTVQSQLKRSINLYKEYIRETKS